jgi:putative membrane protein insertion efficiency factor
MALLSRPMIAGIRAYQWLLRPLFPPACRFHPSCSNYAVESIQRHGGWRGSWLAARRLLRCHPWNAGGFDPVVERESSGLRARLRT